MNNALKECCWYFNFFASAIKTVVMPKYELFQRDKRINMHIQYT